MIGFRASIKSFDSIHFTIYLFGQYINSSPIFAINHDIFLHFSPVLLPSAQGVEDGKTLHQKRISNHRLFNQSEAIHQAHRPSRACKCSQGAHRRVDRLHSLRQPVRYGQKRGPARYQSCDHLPQPLRPPRPSYPGGVARKGTHSGYRTAQSATTSKAGGMRMAPGRGRGHLCWWSLIF